MAALAPNQQIQSEDSSSSVEQSPAVSQGAEQIFLVEGSEDQLILWSAKDKVTPLAPILFEWIDDMKAIRDRARKMVKRIRCSAQPNPAFRHDRLVPSGVNAVSERMQFVSSLEEFGNVCFDKAPEMKAYTKKLVQVETEIDRNHELFLRQVMLYSVKPLKKFVHKTYPAISRVYSDLLKSRNRYDKARQKSNMEKTMASRNDFAEKGRILFKHFVGTRQLQVEIAQAIDYYLRAELQLARNILKAADEFKAPNQVVLPNESKDEQNGSTSV